MKFKNIIFILIILLGLILLFVLIFYKNSETGLVLVSDGEILPKRICDNIKNEDIVIHKNGCVACAVAIPRLEKIEKNLGIKLRYYDLSNEVERTELLNMNFTTQYVPALISDCKAYVGVRSEEEYIRILQDG